MGEKVVFILGPTGVGKTEISVKLAKEFDGQIISSDSVQIYKEFDIGSAKVKKQEMQGIVHYGIDILSPIEEFSAFDYALYTKNKINEIFDNGHLPIVVGGTGLYVKALVEGYNFGETERNQEFRNKIEEEINLYGLEFAYNKLVKLDKDLALKTDEHNKVRIIRALEIATFGSKKEKSGKSEFGYKIFALNLDRELLYERINRRVDIMVENGVVEEAKALYKKYGLVQPMRAIGYKEFIPYFEGKSSLEECVMLIKQHSRNYAKRQLTFLRSMQNIEFIDVKNRNDAFDKIKSEIKSFLD